MINLCWSSSLFFAIIQKPMGKCYWVFVKGSTWVMLNSKLAYKNTSSLWHSIAAVYHIHTVIFSHKYLCMIDFCLSQLKVCDILMKSLNSSIIQHVPAQLRPSLLGLKSAYPDQQAQVYEPFVFSQEAHGEQSATAATHSFKSINNKRPITSQVNMSHH